MAKKHILSTDSRLVDDEVIKIHQSKGNGLLRRQVWSDGWGNVVRYSLAYINHQLFNGDNGRVLGYDNAHGYHHRHFMGKIEPVLFESFLKIEEQFQREFEVMHEKAKEK